MQLIRILVFLIVSALVLERGLVIYAALKERKITYWPVLPIRRTPRSECRRAKNPTGYWLLVGVNTLVLLLFLTMLVKVVYDSI